MDAPNLIFLQVKERSFRSRGGFSQSDGIAQYSANSFYRGRKPRKIDDYHRPPSYEPYRPQRPRTIFAHSDDESYLNNNNNNRHTHSSSSSTTHFPELKMPPNGSAHTLIPSFTKPVAYPHPKKSLVPILKPERKTEKKFPWEQVPKFQNLIFNGGGESDEESIKPGTSCLGSGNSASSDPFYRNGSVSPKFTSHHALCTNQVGTL